MARDPLKRLKSLVGRRQPSVAANRFQQKALRRHADLAQLFADDEAVIVVSDHQRWRHAGDPPRGFLKQAALAEQIMELLGEGFPRQGPQPSAAAA